MNAMEVLKNIDKMLADEGKKSWDMYTVYGKVGIFDWFTDTLSRARLKQMRNFLTNAIVLGYYGHVGFKVGSAGCAHGMWAYKQEGVDGYSPNGACLYHSFRPCDNFWCICFDDNTWLKNRDGSIKELRGAREVVKALAAHEIEEEMKQHEN
jgi:hypothetical protein